MNFVSMHPKNLLIEDFTYDLPREKIALHPVHPRDSAKLLIYNNGTIREDTYQHISSCLPPDVVMVFNDTRVIKSRIFFPKETGAVIEIFCLEPYGDVPDHEHFFSQTGSAQWKCMIGKAGKWKEKYLTKKFWIGEDEVILTAELIDRLPDSYVVDLSWTPEKFSHGEIIEAAGVVPLPPYIKRAANKKDEYDYQTIYSEYEGSVAAPTAGLHFTEEILDKLRREGISLLFTTHHVGAGTFKPVTTETMERHIMHEEWMNITTEFLEQLVTLIDKKMISVGTTSARALESIYWMGNKILNHPDITFENLKVTQWEVYEDQVTHPPQKAVSALLNWIRTRGRDHLMIGTGIIIAPGYSFKIISGLVTNFHMPQSTLLLLVSALVGEDWRKIYQYALDHDFRFLSYGDGSLLIP